jgi:hypothetical protein
MTEFNTKNAKITKVGMTAWLKFASHHLLPPAHNLFPVIDNMGRQVGENPLHLTPYDYISQESS